MYLEAKHGAYNLMPSWDLKYSAREKILRIKELFLYARHQLFLFFVVEIAVRWTRQSRALRNKRMASEKAVYQLGADTRTRYKNNLLGYTNAASMLRPLRMFIISLLEITLYWTWSLAK